jgi:WD40 repeat protein
VSDVQGGIEVRDDSGVLIDRIPNHGFRSQVIAFSPDGETLLIAGHAGPELEANRRIQIWDVASWSLRGTLPTSAYDVAFDPAGDRIVTVDGAQPEIWDIVTGDRIGSLPRQATIAVADAEFSPDGSTIAIASSEAIRLFDAATQEERLVLEGRGCNVRDIAFSPDGSMLASTSCEDTRVWAIGVDELLDVARANVTRTLTDDECRRYLRQETCGS